MTTLRTVFAFLWLVCAIAFASVAYVYMSESTDWKDKHTKLQAEKAKEIEGLNAKISDLTKELETAVAEAKKWKDQAGTLMTTIGERDAEIAKMNVDKKEADDFKKKMEDRMADLTKLLDEQKAINVDMSKKAEDARIAKEAAEKAQRDAEDKQRLLEDDLANLRNQLKLTKSELSSASELNKRYSEVYGEDGLRMAQAAPVPVPQINGKITNVDNPMRLVLISVGKDDGVRTGMTFEVVRTDAQQYVGRVRVLDVQDEQAVCRIDSAMTQSPIVEGDHVTTRVR